MRLRTFGLLCLVIMLWAGCKQQVPATSSAPEPADFSYLSEFDLKPYLEGIGKSAPFQNRLKRLTGKAYPVIILAMEKGNPQGILSDGLWYTLYADYEADGIKYQSTIVADLPKNNLAAGHWDDKTDKVTHFIENAEKVPPPFRAWLEDWN